MMLLELSNLRAIGQAEIAIGTGITSLAGRNKAGKSTLLRVLGALLTGERAPYTGSVGFDAEHLVARGEKQGTATLSLVGGQHRRTATWKAKGESAMVGDLPISVSRLCAGLDLWSGLKKDERLKLLAGVLGAAPTAQQLQAACKLATPEAIAMLAGPIEAGLWDQVHATCDNEAKQAMGAWRKVTGKTWTEKGGAEFAPEGLGQERDADQQQVLRRKYEDLRSWRDTAATTTTSTSPSSDAERTALQAQAAEIEQAQRTLDGFLVELAEHDGKRQATQLQLAQTREPGKPAPTCACPACGKELIVTGPAEVRLAGKVAAKDEVDAQRRAWQAAKAAESSASSAYASMQRNVESARAWVGQCQMAAGQLERLAPPAEASSSEDVELRAKLQAELEAVTAEGRALASFLEAQVEHERVLMWTELRAQSAADGLRRNLLKQHGLADFNARLARWAPALRGTIIRLDEDLAVKDGSDEPYRVLSGAERWLSDVLIMLAIAELEQAPIVVIDEAGMLDDALRGPFLLDVLVPVATERPVVNAYSAGYPEKVPDLARHGLGVTYWVDQGQVSDLAAQLDQQAAVAAE